MAGSREMGMGKRKKLGGASRVEEGLPEPLEGSLAVLQEGLGTIVNKVAYLRDNLNKKKRRVEIVDLLRRSADRRPCPAGGGPACRPFRSAKSCRRRDPLIIRTAEPEGR